MKAELGISVALFALACGLLARPKHHLPTAGKVTLTVAVVFVAAYWMSIGHERLRATQEVAEMPWEWGGW